MLLVAGSYSSPPLALAEVSVVHYIYQQPPILGLVWRDHDSNSADSHFRVHHCLHRCTSSRHTSGVWRQLESNGRIVNALGSAYASQCSSLSFPWLPSLGDYRLRLIVLHFLAVATCICMERGVTSSCVGAVAYAHRWVLFPDVHGCTTPYLWWSSTSGPRELTWLATGTVSACTTLASSVA